MSLPALASALTAAASARPPQQQRATHPASLYGSSRSPSGAAGDGAPFTQHAVSNNGSTPSSNAQHGANTNGSTQSSNGSGQPQEQRPNAALHHTADAVDSSLSRHRQGVERYRALLSLLDGVAAHAIEEALQGLEGVLTEPHVARIVSQHLPPGSPLTPEIVRSHSTLYSKLPALSTLASPSSFPLAHRR